MRKIVIIGGGLAGLITSIQLIRAGISCVVIEKKSYPFHRVCGEYISNEVVPFLKASGLYPEELNVPQIKILELSAISGKSCRLRLDLGGFGISRFSFDAFLYRKAMEAGVEFKLNTEAIALSFSGERFKIETSGAQTLEADAVIGSFGKRSRIDIQQNRSFVQKRSPYVGVKYHVKSFHPEDLISLHNFPGGYCGVCNVENGITNLCYLTHRDNLRNFKTIDAMEENVLFKNPHLRSIFSKSTFLYERPEVINEISFETKAPVENHVLMAGDAAGMIAPLCGNGMAIAIRSAKMLAEIVIAWCDDKINRQEMESLYRKQWNEAFRFRLWYGRHAQYLFGHTSASSTAVTLATFLPNIGRRLVAQTHGKPFA